MTVTESLAAFAHLEPDRISDRARAVFRLSFLDWLAVGVSGARSDIAPMMHRFAADEGGAGQAHMIGGGQVAVRMAALVNGTLSHAIDYDDTHFAHIGHPSVGVIPAALSVAEKLDVSGADMQDAALIGMEASVRAGLWLGRSHYQAGFHQTATAGAIGATLAAARLYGLTVDQTQMALGLVSTRASGLKSQFGTMGKPFNAGLSAANGVEAATLIALGFQANPAGLEAAQGFADTHHAEGDPRALDGIGVDWLMPSVRHKFHACCHGLHAALEALGQVEAHTITAIKVHTNPRWLTVCNQPEPDSGLGAKFSYRVALAMRALGHNTADPASFDDTVCRDPAVIALRDRVTVAGDAGLPETATRLEVLTDTGTVGVSHDLNAPMRLTDRSDRVRTKAHTLMGAAMAERAQTMVGDAAAPRAFGRLIGSFA